MIPLIIINIIYDHIWSVTGLWLKDRCALFCVFRHDCEVSDPEEAGDGQEEEDSHCYVQIYVLIDDQDYLEDHERYRMELLQNGKRLQLSLVVMSSCDVQPTFQEILLYSPKEPNDYSSL